MKKAVLALAFAFGAVLAVDIVAPTTAEAVVCARGVYRAGCAGPRGAVVAPRGGYAYGRAYVAPRRVYAAPRARVYRRW
jgi:hypothetical protein